VLSPWWLEYVVALTRPALSSRRPTAMSIKLDPYAIMGG
jgi:hypothetical protein